jgi:hypothetical protein
MKPSIRIILMFTALGLAVTCFAMERAETFTISGSTGVSGVVMTGLPGNPVTDENGHYSVRVPSGWKGTVSPLKEGYTFTPPAKMYEAVSAEYTNEDYTASVMTFMISGSVGVPWVVMQGLPGDPMTAGDGTYQATVDYGWAGAVRPIKQGYNFQPPTRMYTKVKSDMVNQNYAPQLERLGPRYGRTTGRTDRGRVLVIPTTDVKPEEFEATRADMHVMLYILEKELQKPRVIQGVFFDFGDFFDRDGQALQAVYVQDYGAFFFTEVDFPLVFPAEAQEPPVETTKEQVDPIWQRAQQEMFSSQDPAAGGPFPGRQERGPETLEELKKDLTRLLKHACNIRNLKADEWVILTVIGAGGWIGEGGVMGPSGATVGTRSKSAGGGMYGTGGYGGYGGGGGGYGGYGGGSAGFGGGYGVSGFGFGGMGGASFGYRGMAGVAGMGPASSATLTMRVKKSDVDAFAKGELDFEQFQQKVKIFTY